MSEQDKTPRPEAPAPMDVNAVIAQTANTLAKQFATRDDVQREAQRVVPLELRYLDRVSVLTDGDVLRRGGAMPGAGRAPTAFWGKAVTSLILTAKDAIHYLTGKISMAATGLLEIVADTTISTGHPNPTFTIGIKELDNEGKPFAFVNGFSVDDAGNITLNVTGAYSGDELAITIGPFAKAGQAGVTSLDGLTGDVTIEAGAGIAGTPSGNGFIISAAGIAGTTQQTVITGVAISGGYLVFSGATNTYVNGVKTAVTAVANVVSIPLLSCDS